MAQLPRYQRLGVRTRQPGNIDFADTREQAAYSQNLSGALDRMSQFAFKEASAAAEIRGQERVREDGAVETLAEIDKKGGAFSIADQAAYELGSRVAVAEIQNAAEIETMRILTEGERNETPFSKIQAQLLEITDGYSESLRVIDPASASVLKENINGVAGKAIERYSNYYVNLQASRQKTKQNDAAALQAQNIISGAVIPGSNPVTVRQDVARAGQLLSGLGVSDSAVKTWEANTYKAAIKENFIFNFNSSDTERQTEILTVMETVPAPGLNLSQTQALRGSLKSGLNEKLSARRSASTTIVNEVKNMTYVLESGGMPSQSAIDVLEAQADDLGANGANARVALSTLKFNMQWASMFRGMNLDEITKEVEILKGGLADFGGRGLDTPQEVYTLKTAQSYKAAAEIALKDRNQAKKDLYKPGLDAITSRISELQEAVNSGIEIDPEAISKIMILYKEIPFDLKKDLETSLRELSYTGPLLSELKAGDAQSVNAWLVKLKETGIPNLEEIGIDTDLELKALSIGESVLSAMNTVLDKASAAEKEKFAPVITDVEKQIKTLQSIVDKQISIPEETIKTLIETFQTIPENLRGDIAEQLETLGFTDELLRFAGENNVEGMRQYLSTLEVGGLQDVGNVGPDSPIEYKAITLAQQLVSSMEQAQTDLLAANKTARKEKYDPVVKDIKARISAFEKIVQSGTTVSQEDFVELFQVFSSLPDDFRGDILESIQGVGYLADVVENAQGMNVSQLTQYIEVLGQGFDNARPGGLETLSGPSQSVNTQIEFERLNLAEKMRDQMITGLKNDPLTYGIRAGTLGQNGQPLELNPINITSGSEATIASIKERISVAKTIAGKYLIKPQFFTQSEKSDIQELLRVADSATKMSVFASLVSAGGSDAPDMLTEIAQNSPFDAGIGALVLVDRQPQARSALRGQELLDSGQVPTDFTIKKANNEFNVFAGEALGNLPKTVEVILPVAIAIYADTAMNEPVFSESLWRDAISIALGGLPNGNNSNFAPVGGIQDVRGRETFLPPNISSDQVEDALSSSSIMAFTYASKQEMNPGMAEDIAAKWLKRDNRFQLIRAPEENMYYIVSDKGNNILERGNTGIKYKFDLNKFINYVEGTR